MDIRDRRALKGAAADALSNASCNPRKLVLIHAGASLALSLLLLVLHYILEEQIGSTGGLGGMNNRAMLTTAQWVLQLGQLIAVPFWQIGWLFVTLRIARRERTGVSDLLEGFRRFLPFLRLTLLKGALFFGLGILCSYIASTIFAMTPWSEPLMEIVMKYSSFEDAAAMEAELEAIIDKVVLPLLIIFGVSFLVLAVPFFYRFRMAEYVLLDSEKPRALAALGESRYMMRGNAISLLTLDLSFWWFYALELVTVVVAYLDMILPLFGVELPVSATVLYFGTAILSTVCQLALYWWRKPQVDVTYAQAYLALSEE